MNATGIIVEYNPLHNGHLYHIEETKKQSKCDVLIAVMSGHFVQRGEPAILNKSIRAKQALNAGVDLVIELPYLYSVQSANYFAFGAVKLLDALQVSNLYFGSECGNINQLKTVANYLDDKKVNEEINTLIKSGISYPIAVSTALTKYVDFDLVNPNDILGIRYIKSIDLLNSPIKANTIKRIQANYHDERLSDSSIASATSIRNELYKKQDTAEINRVVPSYVYSDLKTHKLTSWDDFYPYLKYKFLTSKEQLLQIHEMNTEIYNRIIKTIHSCDYYEDLINRLTTKRLTKSRIQRVLCNVLLDVKQEDVGKEQLKKGPNYIRILGLNKIGKDYLKHVKKTVRLPIITNITKQHYEYVAFDEQVADLYHFIDGQTKRKIPQFDQ